MAKAQVKNNPAQKTEAGRANAKERKDKDEDALVGRVKKVIKKSRRKLSEEKFEKQLQRTIAFLEELQVKLGNSHSPSKKIAGGKPAKSNKKAKTKTLVKKGRVSAVVKQAAATSAKKAG